MAVLGTIVAIFFYIVGIGLFIISNGFKRQASSYSDENMYSYRISLMLSIIAFGVATWCLSSVVYG